MPARELLESLREIAHRLGNTTSVLICASVAVPHNINSPYMFSLTLACAESQIALVGHHSQAAVCLHSRMAAAAVSRQMSSRSGACSRNNVSISPVRLRSSFLSCKTLRNTVPCQIQCALDQLGSVGMADLVGLQCSPARLPSRQILFPVFCTRALSEVLPVVTAQLILTSSKDSRQFVASAAFGLMGSAS